MTESIRVPPRTTEPVFITGVGVASAYGHSLAALGDGVLSGRSVIRRIEHFNVEQHPSQIGGPMAAVPCPEGEDESTFRQLPRLEQTFRWCAATALRDAGLWESRKTMRLGVCVGVGAEWMQSWEEDYHAGGTAVLNPGTVADTLGQRLGTWLQVRGASTSVSGACASGNHAIAVARTWLQMGWVDAVLTGACDTGVSEISLAAFGNLRALSRRNDNPAGASRPFDKARDGFVMGEGGALYILERASTARARSVPLYAEVAGYGASSDAHHMVIPSPTAAPSAEAIRLALRDAGVNADEIGYINAHATSTPVGDTAEARALYQALGDIAGTIPISSTKSMTGHLLTGAAALEAAICLIALHRQAVPPTINLTDPDPECPLAHIANMAQQRRVRVALSNSFGFGGSNTSLILRAA
jgi:3-oxoacyl-[acyl-carrier-protein] synthase II